MRSMGRNCWSPKSGLIARCLNFLAGDPPEDRGLAGAVGPDQPDLLALLQSHRRVDEQDLMAVLLADVVEADHGRVCLLESSANTSRSGHLYCGRLSSCPSPSEWGGVDIRPIIT